MTRIRVRTTIRAPRDVVWEDVSDLASHVEWMADAEELRFTSATRAGVGTTFDCLTKVGPIRLTDRMEVTEWLEGERIGVRHVGLVTGTGRFTLRSTRLGRATSFAWEEELRFPWWLGGRVGELPGSLVLRLVWRRNLRRLRRRF